MNDYAECSRSASYRRAMPGEKGWRSPLPEWWVDEANERLRRRGIDKKTLARSLQGRGHAVSEMMVLRALHPDPIKRIATIETIDAISDALGIPRPVVVAGSFADALELQRTVSFSAADAERLRISAEVDLQARGESAPHGSDARATGTVTAVDDGRARAVSTRPAKTRRAPRAR